MVKVFDLTLRLALTPEGERPGFHCTCDEIPAVRCTSRSRGDAVTKTKAGALTVLAHRLREGEMPDLEVITVELVDETGVQGSSISGSGEAEGEKREGEESG